MNYFGMFFSFMLPGLALGAMAAAVLKDGGQKKKRPVPQRTSVRKTPQDKLYIYDLAKDVKGSAA